MTTANAVAEQPSAASVAAMLAGFTLVRTGAESFGAGRWGVRPPSSSGFVAYAESEVEGWEIAAEAAARIAAKDCAVEDCAA